MAVVVVDAVVAVVHGPPWIPNDTPTAAADNNSDDWTCSSVLAHKPPPD